MKSGFSFCALLQNVGQELTGKLFSNDKCSKIEETNGKFFLQEMIQVKGNDACSEAR
jgi:hypothetical protein